jgi:ATP synthase protein I
VGFPEGLHDAKRGETIPMTDGEKRGSGQGQSVDPKDRRLQDRLDALNARLPSRGTDAGGAASGGRGARREDKGLAQGLRLSSEFVAGTVTGVGIGWLTDHFLGSSPWGLVVFTLLGFAAGIYNMMRAVGALPKAGEPPDDGGPRR